MTLRTSILARPVIASILLLVAGCDDKQPAKQHAMGPMEVSVVTVTSQAIPLYTDLPGRTSAFRVAEVRPQVSGILVKRLFTEGSDVKAGQQLYQIAEAPYQAALQSANADLAKAKANRQSIEAKAARYAELVKINAVSRQDYDDIIASRDQAAAAILGAEAEVQTARINLAYTKVYAPISGHISKSNVTEGALVTAEQANALTMVTQLDPIYVDVSQSSSDVIRLRHAAASGQINSSAVNQAKATLTLDGSDQPYDQPGVLQFADVTVDPSTGAVQLRAIFPNPHHDLYPGLFVRARVEQGVKDAAILIPQQALVRSVTGATVVWVVEADNKVNPHPVEVGQALGDKWVITSGLAPNQQVVVEGLQKIRPGAVVTPVAAPAPVKP